MQEKWLLFLSMYSFFLANILFDFFVDLFFVLQDFLPLFYLSKSVHWQFIWYGLVHKVVQIINIH